MFVNVNNAIILLLMDAQGNKHGIEVHVFVRHAKLQLVDVEILNCGIATCVNALAHH